MVFQTAKDISDNFHAAAARAIASLRLLPLVPIILFSTAGIWLIGAGWWNYIRPQEFDLSRYERYQEQLAGCRELKTSEARYDCVAQALIGRDQTNFVTTMIVFLPPFALIMSYFLWREVQTSRREREHARLAEQRARAQVSKFRQDMRNERASAAEKTRSEIALNEHAHGPHAALLNHVRSGTPSKHS